VLNDSSLFHFHEISMPFSGSDANVHGPSAKPLSVRWMRMLAAHRRETRSDEQRALVDVLRRSPGACVWLVHGFHRRGARRRHRRG
jgi:hypothetical protein